MVKNSVITFVANDLNLFFISFNFLINKSSIIFKKKLYKVNLPSGEIILLVNSLVFISSSFSIMLDSESAEEQCDIDWYLLLFHL